MQGVMLSHANLKYQLDNLDFFLSPRAGERSLSLLPPWHIYERSCGYFLYSRACTQVELKYLACTQMRELQSDQEPASSHPGLPCMRFIALWAYLFIATQMVIPFVQVYTNIRKFKEDLSLYPPHHFVCVPLVLDTLYGRVSSPRKTSARYHSLQGMQILWRCCFIPCSSPRFLQASMFALLEARNNIRARLQVQAQIKKGSAVKRALARLFFAAGTAYVRARRIVEGVALQYAHRAPSMPRVMLAAFVAAVLYPIYR